MWNRIGFDYYGGRESADTLQLDLPETFGKRVFSPKRNSAPNIVNVQPQYAAHVAEFIVRKLHLGYVKQGVLELLSSWKMLNPPLGVEVPQAE